MTETVVLSVNRSEFQIAHDDEELLIRSYTDRTLTRMEIAYDDETANENPVKSALPNMDQQLPTNLQDATDLY